MSQYPPVNRTRGPVNTFNTLVHIAALTYNCNACGLCSTRNNSVPGEGHSQARLMFVGEGPGETEDLEGRPFVGRAGDLLNQALVRANLDREDVFITNVVKCRPPGNRNPTTEEMQSCSPYLTKQIATINPKLIVLLGKVAAEFLLQRPVKITKENGKLDFLTGGTCVMTVLHPAYVLRNQQPEVRESFFRAIQDARNIAYGNSDPGLHA